MSDKNAVDYTQAGVDIDAANQWLDGISDLAKQTPQSGVVSGIGGFGAQFALPTGMREPILVSATDGVGTKLKLALRAGKHHSMGIDLVAMCANDIITSGAKPLYFLDYYATDKLNPQVATEILRAISQACTECNMALIGGETAEMPGCYPKDHYDLAGFCVGIIEREDIIDGKQVKDGDQIIALASSGVHANGFSLVRHILETQQIDPVEYRLDEQRLIDILLTPTQLYVAPLLELIQTYRPKAIAHITGGGIIDNLPRVLPPHCEAVIQPYDVPAVFAFLQQQAQVSDEVMRRTFNMGVGMLLVVDNNELQPALSKLQQLGETAWHIGHIQSSEQSEPKVIYTA